MKTIKVSLELKVSDDCSLAEALVRAGITLRDEGRVVDAVSKTKGVVECVRPEKDFTVKAELVAG